MVTRFPESRYAEDSAARMRYLVNALASHEVHVARYYMKRGAYLAAANRAQVRDPATIRRRRPPRRRCSSWCAPTTSSA